MGWVRDNNTKLNIQSINNSLKLVYHSLNEGLNKKTVTETESWTAVARKKKIQHFYCIFLFVLNAVLNTDLLGSLSLELFQMDVLWK